MNWETAFIVGNQAYANARLDQVNNRLEDLYTSLQDASDQRAQQVVLRKLAFSLREALEECEAAFEGSPTLYLVVARHVFNARLRGVSSQAMEELADKEYTRKVFKYAEQIQISCGLTQEEADELTNFVTYEYCMPIYHRLVRWKKMLELLPSGGGVQLSLLLITPFVLGFLLITWFCFSGFIVAPLVGNIMRSKEAETTVLGVLFAIGVLVAIGSFLALLGSYLFGDGRKFRRNFPTCQKLASEIGQTLPKDVEHGYIRNTIDILEGRLRHVGMDTLNSSRDYEVRMGVTREFLQNAIIRHELPIALK